MTPPAGPTKRRTVVACLDCGVHWSPLAEPARCVEGDHRHQHFEVHLHRSVIVLPDGTSVMAVLRPRRPLHPGSGARLWVLSRSPVAATVGPRPPSVAGLRRTSEHRRGRQRPSGGCSSGPGQTRSSRSAASVVTAGPAPRLSACLAIITGLPAPEAVAWVRSNYCPSVVESAAAGGPHRSDFGLKIRYDTQVARDPQPALRDNLDLLFWDCRDFGLGVVRKMRTTGAMDGMG